MASWPGTLPQKLLVEGYNEPFAENRVKTPMDVGPPKMRKRQTAAPQIITGKQFLTAAQLETLRTFFDDTTNFGVDVFTWTHPTKADGRDFQFWEPPVVEPVSGVTFVVTYTFLVKPA